MTRKRIGSAGASRVGGDLALSKLPVVALVGRANVGKSTLWNRLTETGRALVSSIPHTTRDRNFAPVCWRGSLFQVVDTGGMDAEQGSEIGRGIIRQAELAVRQADLVLFMIDVKSGVMPQDREFASRVRSINPKVILVANKADTTRDIGTASGKDVWSLSLGAAIACSAGNGQGVGDLLDRVHEELAKIGKPPVAYGEYGNQPLKVVVMGRPNVGKSSIVNSILGEERVITSPIPHTTREPMDTRLTWKEQDVILVDTAGMRRRSRVERGVEEVGIERNRDAIHRSDIALLVLDATEGIHDQDKNLAGLVIEEKKGLVIAVNKWDLVEEKDKDTSNNYEAYVRHALPFAPWAQIVFVSAVKDLRTKHLLDLALEVQEERRRWISYNALQKMLKDTIKRQRPLQASGPQSPYIHDVTQTAIEPPTFVINVRGQKALLRESWMRFFENRLRDKFGFQGTTLDVKARILPIVTEEMPEAIRNRPTRRKRPMGRRVGRY